MIGERGNKFRIPVDRFQQISSEMGFNNASTVLYFFFILKQHFPNSIIIDPSADKFAQKKGFPITNRSELIKNIRLFKKSNLYILHQKLRDVKSPKPVREIRWELVSLNKECYLKDKFFLKHKAIVINNPTQYNYEQFTDILSASLLKLHVANKKECIVGKKDSSKRDKKNTLRCPSKHSSAPIPVNTPPIVTDKELSKVWNLDIPRTNYRKRKLIALGLISATLLVTALQGTPCMTESISSATGAYSYYNPYTKRVVIKHGSLINFDLSSYKPIVGKLPYVDKADFTTKLNEFKELNMIRKGRRIRKLV